MKITDAAVQAIEKIKKIAGSFINEGSRDYPHLSLGFEVKKLEWRDQEGVSLAVPMERAISYGVVKTTRCKSEGFWSLSICGNYSRNYATLEQAKAAAQADFERRVRECIVAKPVDVDAIKTDHEKEMAEVIKERDQAEAWADKLSRAIGGEGIGEHSNINNPWENALEIAENRNHVDVAAVQSSALIELLHDMRFRLENMGSTDETDADLIERIFNHVDHIRALSAEPAQGEQSDSAALAQGGE